LNTGISGYFSGTLQQSIKVGRHEKARRRQYKRFMHLRRHDRL